MTRAEILHKYTQALMSMQVDTHFRPEIQNKAVDLHQMLLAHTYARYRGRKIQDLTAAECRELIAVYGDVTNELAIGHDDNDTQMWQDILMGNLETTDSSYTLKSD